jgi:hypothetical protein
MPQLVNTLPIEGAYDVHINYPRAYVASVTHGFHIFDVSDPESLVILGHSDINARGVFAKYPYAYLAIITPDEDGLKILDISSPDSIVELGYCPILITVDVYVQDTIAYVASSFDGVYLVDVSDPENPTKLSNVSSHDWTTDVHVAGHLLYTADGYGGVRVIDVSDPSYPEEVGYSLAGFGDQLHIVEPYLYLSGDYSGLHIFDISIPDSIHEVGYYTGIFTDGIYSDGEYVYVGTALEGFYIFEFTPTGIISDDPDGPGRIPRSLALYQNYPNPFNPSTTISFDIPGRAGEKRRTNLSIYDLRGRCVKVLIDEFIVPGNHRIIWDGRDERGGELPSGVYFYRMKSSDWISIRKMIVVR